MKQISIWFKEFEKFNGEILDKAAKLKNQTSEPLFFMMSALCFEINDAEKFLSRITNQTNLIKYVLNMKELLYKLKNSDNIMKIFDASICPDDLILLFHEIYGTEKNLRENLEIYKSRMSQPFLTGKDLISKGFKPGLLFGEALKFAHELRLEGKTKDEQFNKALEILNKNS